MQTGQKATAEINEVLQAHQPLERDGEEHDLVDEKTGHKRMDQARLVHFPTFTSKMKPLSLWSTTKLVVQGVALALASNGAAVQVAVHQAEGEEIQHGEEWPMLMAVVAINMEREVVWVVVAIVEDGKIGKR